MLRFRPLQFRSALAGLACGLGLLLTAAPSATAGLLRPMLVLLRPQLESRLSRLCLELTAADNPTLEKSLRRPCERLATPASHCLVEETASSGQELAVLGELLGGRLGDASEAVLKRCAAKLLGLPADSFQEVPLADLGRRFKRSGASSGNNAQPPEPASPESRRR